MQTVSINMFYHCQPYIIGFQCNPICGAVLGVIQLCRKNLLLQLLQLVSTADRHRDGGNHYCYFFLVCCYRCRRSALFTVDVFSIICIFFLFPIPLEVSLLQTAASGTAFASQSLDCETNFLQFRQGYYNEFAPSHCDQFLLL